MSDARTMRALVQKHDGYSSERSTGPLETVEPLVELAQIAVPSPAKGQVLVKVTLASVNPSDTSFIQGVYGQPRRKGKAAGFEGVGIVEAAGDPAWERLVGKRVAFAVGQSGGGSWAEYTITDAAGCIPLIDGVRDEDGAAMIVNPLTALAMFGIVREEGEKAFIVTAGASQLCKLILSVAAEAGFRPIAIVRRDDQTGLLEAAGAAHVLNASAPDFAVRLAEVCKAEKPRILLDATTGPAASAAFAAMPRGARWIIYGRLDGSDTVIQEPGQLIFMAKRIEGFWLAKWLGEAAPETRLAAISEAQGRFADGRWRTDVTAIIPLEETIARLPAELAKPNGKVFIRP